MNIHFPTPAVSMALRREVRIYLCTKDIAVSVPSVRGGYWLTLKWEGLQSDFLFVGWPAHK